MRPALLVLLAACGVAAHVSVLSAAPPVDAAAAQQGAVQKGTAQNDITQQGSGQAGTPEERGQAWAERAVQAWTTSGLAPLLVERCASQFPDRSVEYRKALQGWEAENKDLIASGQVLFRRVLAARVPDKDPELYASLANSRVLSQFDRKNAADRYAHCESVNMTLTLGSK